jgi:hypothetical protein
MLTALVLVFFAAVVRKGLAVKPAPNEEWEYEHLQPKVLAVRRPDWLETPTGEWIVAIGVIAIALSLFAFTVQDVSMLVTGKLYSSALLRSVWYLLWAGLATVFSAACVFILQPALPRLVIALFSVSMASHILERFVRMPALQLRLLALCRLVVSLGVVLVYLRHRFDEPEALK